jgi:hypothetical protein
VFSAALRAASRAVPGGIAATAGEGRHQCVEGKPCTAGATVGQFAPRMFGNSAAILIFGFSSR